MPDSGLEVCQLNLYTSFGIHLQLTLSARDGSVGGETICGEKWEWEITASLTFFRSSSRRFVRSIFSFSKASFRSWRLPSMRCQF